MGAQFNTMKLPADVSRNEIEQRFRNVQDQDRYENGHSYSGGFGMAAGLRLVDRQFDNRAAAREWLDDNCQKWEEALGVRYTADDGKVFWLIGALCSS